jgi:hypothetical protein
MGDHVATTIIFGFLVVAAAMALFDVHRRL